MDFARGTIRHLSLCTGYGGIDLGLRRVLPNCRTLAYVEVEAFAIANLVSKMEAGYLDPAPLWTDIKTLPLECFPKGIEIISGGFPCTPFSVPGRRNADSDGRHLFPYIKNAIRVIRPRYVFLENVEGIITSELKGDHWGDPAGTPVLLHVLRELEREDYRCSFGMFTASEVGGPHQRKRVFILAHADESGLEGRDGGELSECPVKLSFREGSPQLRWPSLPEEDQHEWEHPRVAGNRDRDSGSGNGEIESELGGAVDGPPPGWVDTIVCPVANRTDRLRMLGNGCVPAVVAKAFSDLLRELHN